MEKKATVLQINQNEEMIKLGEVKIKLEPRYADGGFFIRNIVHYGKYLEPSKEVDANYMRKQAENSTLRGTIYYYSEEDGIRKCISKLEYNDYFILSSISDWIPTSQQEEQMVKEKLNL